MRLKTIVAVRLACATVSGRSGAARVEGRGGHWLVNLPPDSFPAQTAVVGKADEGGHSAKNAKVAQNALVTPERTAGFEDETHDVAPASQDGHEKNYQWQALKHAPRSKRRLQLR